MLKRLFAAQLAIMLLVSLHPFQTLASDLNEKAQIQYIQLLSDSHLTNNEELEIGEVGKESIILSYRNDQDNFYFHVGDENLKISRASVIPLEDQKVVKDLLNNILEDKDFITRTLNEDFIITNSEDSVHIKLYEGNQVRLFLEKDNYYLLFGENQYEIPEEYIAFETSESNEPRSEVVEQVEPVTESKAEEVENVVEVVEESQPTKENTLVNTSTTIEATSFTAENDRFIVTDNYLPVYVNENNKLEVKGYLYKDQVYPRESDYGNWHKIKFGNDYGFVWKKGTSPTTKLISSYNSSYKNSSLSFTSLEDTVVYDNNNGQLIPFAKFSKGVTYPVVSDYGNWYRIDVSGRVGYVQKNSIKPVFNNSIDYFKPYQNLSVYVKRNGDLVKVSTLLDGKVYKRIKDYGGWHQILIGNEYGYVWKENTFPILKANMSNKYKGEAQPFKMTLNQQSIIYDNSKGKLIPIAVVEEGTSYSIIQNYGSWVKVQISGLVGFIHKSGVDLEFTNNIKYFKATEGNIAVYDNRSGKLLQVGELRKGQTYERISAYGSWHKIKFGNYYGFVYAGHTEPMLSRTYKNASYNHDVRFTFLAKENLTVYDNTSGKLVEYGQINSGKEFVSFADYGHWLKVNFAGRHGFVKKDKVKLINTFNPHNVVNPNVIYTYDQMRVDLNEFVSSYPGLVSLSTIGKSVDGRDLYAIKVGKGSTEILIHGSHHAREHMTTNIIMEMIDQYTYGYAKNTKIDGYNVKDILDKTTIWFVPMVNPDGVTLVQKGHKSSKDPNFVLKVNGGSTNFSSWKANIRGVDLNRNYPAGWNYIVSDPGKPATQNYKGPKPLSEPETKALHDFTLKHNFKTAVSYHSSGSIIYWNFKQTGSRLERDRKIGQMISNKTGYSLVPVKSNPSGGGYTDWFIDSLKKPGFTPELAPYVGPRPVPLSLFDSEWNKNKAVGIMLADEAYRNRNSR